MTQTRLRPVLVKLPACAQLATSPSSIVLVGNMHRYDSAAMLVWVDLGSEPGPALSSFAC